MFTWSKHKEETKNGYVGHRGSEIVGRGGGEVMHHGKWNGFDAVGWWVKPGVAAKLLLNAIVGVTGAGVPLVLGPHAGHFLANGAEGCFHCPSAYRSVGGGQLAASIPVGKDLEDRNVILDVGKEWIDAQAVTILGPSNPGGIASVSSGRNDAGSERLHRRLVISAECNLGRRVDSCQGFACGYVELKWSRSLVLDKCHKREASSAMVLRGPGK